MIDQNQKTKLSDDDGLSSKKLPEEQKGATIFFIAQADHDQKEVSCLDTPDRLVPFWISKEEMEDNQYIYNTCKDIYTLTMKAGGKELDPRYFDEIERNAFNSLIKRNGLSGLRIRQCES